MSLSRTKFVIFFLISAFVFQFISNSLLGSKVRLFPGQGESYLVTDSGVGWKNVISTTILPIKIILIGPLVPYIDFLRQEPDTPPPFFLVGFICYWTILALCVYYFLNRLKDKI